MSAAVAATVVLASSSGGAARYQHWVDGARVATPRERVEVVAAPCPGAGADRSCTTASQPVIYLGAGAGRRVFFHELGHRFDYRMPAWVRDRFRALIGDQRSWDAAPASPREQFADAYSLCALDPRAVPQGFVSVVGYRPTLAIHRSACRLIAAAARAEPHKFGLSRSSRSS